MAIGMTPSDFLQALPAAVQGVHTVAAEAEANGQARKSGFWSKFLTGAAVAGALGGVGVILAEDEAEHGLHAPQYPWSHNGFFSAYDHASIRRGHQVYTQVRAPHCDTYIPKSNMVSTGLQISCFPPFVTCNILCMDTMDQILSAFLCGFFPSIPDSRRHWQSKT